MTKTFVTIILSVWILAGCLPDPLPVGRIPQLEPKIVVSSQILPNQSVVILLTKSFGALDANNNSDPQALLNQIAINDALVIIENGISRDTLILTGTGIYVSGSIPLVEEGVYTLRVESPSMGSVTAMTRVKTPVTFTSLRAEISDTGFDTLARINYSMRDLIGKNFYMINVQYFSAAELPQAVDFLNPNVFIKLLEDVDARDGEIWSESFNVIFQRDFIPGDTVLVQLANISKEYHDFLKLRQDSRFNFSDFLGEPINYPSNVKGGLGWFTLHIPDARIIEVNK